MANAAERNGWDRSRPPLVKPMVSELSTAAEQLLHTASLLDSTQVQCREYRAHTSIRTWHSMCNGLSLRQRLPTTNKDIP